MRPSVRFLSVPSLLASLLGVQAVHAVELTEWLRLDGFGTLSAYQADDPVAGVRADQRTSQVTSNKKWRWDGDSQLTTQFTVNPNGEFRGVLQLLAKDDVDKRFRPRVEWAYGSWDVTPSLNLKLGRVVAPVFLLSDTRNVGYAQTPVRPVNTVYQVNPVTSIDGLNLNWSTDLGGGTLGVEAAVGKTDISLTNGQIKINRYTSAALRWNQGPLTLRVGRSDFELDGTLPSTQAALATLASGATGCTNCAAVFADRFRFNGIKGSIDTAALLLELGDFALQSEWARRPSNSTLIPDTSAWYLQASYRVGAWTPYAVLGSLKFSEPALGLQTAPGAPPSATAANAAFDLFLQNRNDRDIRQVGVRWDFRENFALKLQFESMKQTRPPFLGINSVVATPNVPPIGTYTGPAFDGKVNLISVNLDFVF